MKFNLAFLLAASILLSLSSRVRAQQTEKVTPGGIGYLQYLPQGYQSGSENYPVVISLHGIKEKGTSSIDPKMVMKDLHRVANVGLPKYVRMGEKYSFILISPQLKDQYGTWPPSFVIEVLNHVKKTLRVDDKRIYLTGLSLGGYGVWKTAGEYPGVFAAIAPVCPGGNALEKAHAIAKEDIAVWGFHGSRDYVVSHTVTTNMINAINSAPHKPDPLAKVTIFPGLGHIIWDKAYHETNVLDWMLSFRNGSRSSQQETNSQPVVKAGEDIVLTLPANSVKLEGHASDQDGDITGYTWTKVSGPEATLRDGGNPTLMAENLVEGIYIFRLTARDNNGGSGSDEVTVTVQTTKNSLPVVSVGADRTLTLPQNSLELKASANDEDGSIQSYLWKKVSGGPVEMRGEVTSTLTISGLLAGIYSFQLTVSDDDGASAQDVVIVSVLRDQSTAEASSAIYPVDFNGYDKSSRLKQGIIQPVGLPWFNGN